MPISEVDRNTSDRFCFGEAGEGGGGVALHLGAVLTGIRTVAEGNKKDRGLEPTETEVNIFKSKDWDL